MAYTYTNKKGTKYYLHKRNVVLRGSGKNQTIYFFSQHEGKGSIDELPAGFEVMEIERTGLPLLRKK